MNTTYRFLTGTLSSLLLAMGFQRLAAHLDPLSRNQAANAVISGVVADSGINCWAEINGVAADSGINCWAELPKN